MNRWQFLVANFHEKFGVPSGRKIGLHRPELRAALIREESMETTQAIDDREFLYAVDGLVDTIYVCLGAALEWGIDLDPLFREVHRANMAKEGGSFRSDGKILKGAGWTPPDIEGELRKQGWDGK